jgi:hypothetical protein
MERMRILKALERNMSIGVPSSRKYDPVVLKGSDLPELLGIKVEFIVAFQLNYTINKVSNWTQIPIQIDEMHVQDWEIIKHGDCR